VEDRAGRSPKAITIDDLARLSEITAKDRAARFARVPRWKPYADRVICVALCQGAALHFVDGVTGVKDFDVWTFYAEHPVGAFPQRWRTVRDFGPSPFGATPGSGLKGRRVDLFGRSLPAALGADPVAVLRAYLAEGTSPSAARLREKAAVLLDPEPLRGTVAWPISTG
jgi:hypothetical protein